MCFDENKFVTIKFISRFVTETNTKTLTAMKTTSKECQEYIVCLRHNNVFCIPVRDMDDYPYGQSQAFFPNEEEAIQHIELIQDNSTPNGMLCWIEPGE